MFIQAFKPFHRINLISVNLIRGIIVEIRLDNSWEVI